MRFLLLFSTTLVIILSSTSCDKIKYPIKVVTELDTTLFTDGAFATYPWPTFEVNTNSDRNVMIEDYTGHKCIGCPAAATVAANIESANAGRVFVASIHGSPGGSYTPLSFQGVSADCSDPATSFCHDFRTPEGEEYVTTFDQGFNFLFNPSGTISRKSYGTDMFFKKNFWEGKVDDLLAENDLKVNLQAKSNYYAASKGVYLHVQSDFLEDLTGDYSIVTYVLQNEVIADQDSAGVHLYYYHHHNAFIGCIDGQAWGQAIGETDPVAGATVQTDYSYVIPTGMEPDEIHFLTYIFNANTYEVLQVIKHEL